MIKFAESAGTYDNRVKISGYTVTEFAEVPALACIKFVSEQNQPGRDDRLFVGLNGNGSGPISELRYSCTDGFTVRTDLLFYLAAIIDPALIICKKNEANEIEDTPAITRTYRTCCLQ
jgi:hypothetical protein